MQGTPSNKIVILDRDGVINEDSDDYIKSVDEWVPVPESLESIGRLCTEGFKVFVFTNQSGIGRGYYDLETMQDIHDKMFRLLKEMAGHIEAIFFCPHTPTQKCACRKPKTGMLDELAERYEIDLTEVNIVGDSFKDIQAGLAVGANVHLVKTGKGKGTIRDHKPLLQELNIPMHKNLSACVDTILANHAKAS